MPNRLAKAILDYIKHISDEAYFDRLLERWSPAEIAQAVAELTASADHQTVSLATLFAEDGRRLMHYVGFHDRLVEAGFRDVLLANLSRPSFFVRRDAVVVLGRIFPEAVPTLIALYPQCIERDPLLIPPLLMSISLLSSREHRRRWAYVRVTTASGSYLTRWTACGIAYLSLGCMGQDGSRAEAILRLLAEDSHPLVSAEATFCLRERRVRVEALAYSPDEQRQVLQALAAEPAPLTYGLVEGTFTNYLWSEQIGDYDLDLLDAWVRHREQHPLPTTEHYDRSAVEADFRRFTAAYRSTH
jgi:hypothetical protein